MVRLLLWLGVGCVVLLVAGGTSFAPAAETESAAATDEKARPTLADVEIRKAEVRVAYAKAALAEAQARVDAGTADKGAVRAAERDLEQAKLALMETQLRAQEWESQRVSLDVKDAALDDALRLLFKDTPYSYVLSPEIGRLALDPLTIRLKEVDLQTAVRVICDTYDLLYRKEDSIYYFFPRADVVTIGGRTVPVLGTLEVPHGAELSFSSSPGPGEVSRTMVVKAADSLLGEGRRHNLQLAPEATEKPIDLQLDNVPIREAMARLAEAAEMDIVVHEAVPEDIRITARVYRVSGRRLLREVADQAGLTVVLQQATEVLDQYDVPIERRYLRYHVVPPPVVEVHGTGGEWPQERSGVRLRRGPSAWDRFLQWQAGEGENFAAVPFPQCLNCEQLIMGPDWQFCPRCGEKLPCDEEVGAEAK